MIFIFNKSKKSPTFLGWGFCLKSKQFLGKIKVLRQVALLFFNHFIVCGKVMMMTYE